MEKIEIEIGERLQKTIDKMLFSVNGYPSQTYEVVVRHTTKMISDCFKYYMEGNNDK